MSELSKTDLINLMETRNRDINALNPLFLEIENCKNNLLGIRTFDNINAWDDKAQVLMTKIQTINNEIENEKRQVHENMSKAESGKSGFFGKIGESMKLSSIYSQYKTTTEHLSEKVESESSQLLDLIDLSPNTKQERDEKVKELKEIKDELKLKIKEINMELKEIRQNARATNTNISMLSGKYGKLARLSTRLDKENKLRTPEMQKNALEKKIIEFEKIINWMKSIS